MKWHGMKWQRNGLNHWPHFAPRARDSTLIELILLLRGSGWSGGAKVLGKLPVPGRPTYLDYSRARPTALAVGAGGGCLDIFSLVYQFSLLLPLFGRRPDID